MPYRDTPLFLFGNSISAEAFSFAFGTSSPLPDVVEVVGGGIDQLGVVGEDTGLEVAVVVAFHTHAGAREVGGADVGGGAVENHYFEMHPWAESPLQTAPQPRILVEILAEILSWLFGMQQPHIDTPFSSLSNTDRNGTTSRTPSTYKSFKSAVPIQRSCLTFSQSASTFV